MKHSILRITGLSLATALIATSAIAQSPVDIGLHHNGTMLEVHVRPQSDFNGIFSSLVYTIKWDSNSGASLGDVTQEQPSSQYIPTAKSGDTHQVGTTNFQVFAGFGMAPMSSASAQWVAGEDYVIAKIPVTGNADFELINDSWTGEVVNNASYYVALGGANRTGIIYKSLATADEDGVTILPNPSNGQFTFSFSNNEAMDVTIELVNTLGQTVMSEEVRALNGPYRKDVDLTSASSGLYYLKIKRGEDTTTHKVVIR